MKEIVPWTCHVCESEFNTANGGICARCRKATCRSHILSIEDKMNNDSIWVCDFCLTDDEKVSKSKSNKKTVKAVNISFKKSGTKSNRAS